MNSKSNRHKKTSVLAGAEVLGSDINLGEEIVMSDISTVVAKSNVIPFRSCKLLLVEHNGQPFVPMKPVVEGMGLAWQTQHRKLMEGRFASTITIMVIVAEDGKNREMACLPLKKLPGWLMSIHASKVRADLRENVLAYQDECDDALWAYWNEGHAINHRGPGQAMTVLGQTIGTDGFHMLGAVVKGKVSSLPALIQRRVTAKIWSQVHAAFGVRSAADIPADQLDAARNFIAAYVVLEGEYIQAEKEVEGLFLDKIQAQHLYLLMSRFAAMSRHKESMLSAARALDSRPLMEFFDQLTEGGSSFAHLDQRRDELYEIYQTLGCKGGYAWSKSA
jgi:hypothetical protein